MWTHTHMQGSGTCMYLCMFIFYGGGGGGGRPWTRKAEIWDT